MPTDYDVRLDQIEAQDRQERRQASRRWRWVASIAVLIAATCVLLLYLVKDGEDPGQALLHLMQQVNGKLEHLDKVGMPADTPTVAPGVHPEPASQPQPVSQRPPVPTAAVVSRTGDWWRIAWDGSQADLWSCQLEQSGNGPFAAMYLADMERHPYRMHDVTENGEVVETTMTGFSFREVWMIPTPREGEMTWYKGKDRCDRVLRAMREGARQEWQRREKYR